MSKDSGKGGKSGGHPTHDGAILKAPPGMGKPQGGNVIKAPPVQPPKKGK
jgi:hypothetical protein